MFKEYNEQEEKELSKFYSNKFINSIDTKTYSKIRGSKGDAECRRYLWEHLNKV